MPLLPNVPVIIPLTASIPTPSLLGNRWSWGYKRHERSADSRRKNVQRLWPLRGCVPRKNNHTDNGSLSQKRRNYLSWKMYGMRKLRTGLPDCRAAAVGILFYLDFNLTTVL